jgi:hypothetical protein
MYNSSWAEIRRYPGCRVLRDWNGLLRSQSNTFREDKTKSWQLLEPTPLFRRFSRPMSVIES